MLTRLSHLSSLENRRLGYTKSEVQQAVPFDGAPMFLISWPGGSWQTTVERTLYVLGAYLAVIWVALIFWTYRDIRQRSRDPIIQFAAVLLVLVFFFPGHWIYLILRPRQTLVETYERSLEEEALLQELEDQKACPTCKRRIQDDYLVCPSCGVQLKEPCRSCGKPLSYAWSMCPYCGLPKAARERAGRPRQQPAQPPPAERAPVGGSGVVTRPAGSATAAPSRDGTTVQRPPTRTTPASERPPSLDDAPLIDATRE